MGLSYALGLHPSKRGNEDVGTPVFHNKALSDIDNNLVALVAQSRYQHLEGKLTISYDQAYYDNWPADSLIAPFCTLALKPYKDFLEDPLSFY